MYLAFFEVIAIAWFYGVWRLAKNIENMNAKTPSLYFKFCWMIAAPLFIMVSRNTTVYNKPNITYIRYLNPRPTNCKDRGHRAK